MICPKKICQEHGFTTVEIKWTNRGYWGATAHGKDTGEFGCAQVYGDTPEAAVANLLKEIRTYREDLAAIAAGDTAAKAKRIEAIRAELASLTGEAA